MPRPAPCPKRTPRHFNQAKPPMPLARRLALGAVLALSIGHTTLALAEDPRPAPDPEKTPALTVRFIRSEAIVERPRLPDRKANPQLAIRMPDREQLARDRGLLIEAVRLVAEAHGGTTLVLDLDAESREAIPALLYISPHLDLTAEVRERYLELRPAP